MRYLLFILVIFIFGCKKESNIFNQNTGDFISFSVDTLLFDTVFTTIGSTTRYLKVYNNYNEDINIDLISLARQENSPFKLNIDGESNHSIENTVLRNGDSLYIFAEVTIDPNGTNNALIETDSIIFTYNNMVQDVDLAAWGRDAYFHSGVPDFQQDDLSNNLDSMLYSEFFDSIPNELINEKFYYYSINQNTQWSNDKPHVVYGDVIIENGSKLTIQQGAEIYLHSKSWIVVDESSSLESLGTLSMPIIIQSDRLDSHSIINYATTPGQWGKIWIMAGSKDNYFEYTIMKNGQTGIHVDGVNNIDELPNNPILTINNSIIYNMSNIGLLAQGTKIQAKNLLIANCGTHLLALNIGGDYDFKHCTFANFWPFSSRQTPSIYLNNYYEDNTGNIQNRDLIQANFGNSIIMGSNENEVLFDRSDGAIFNYSIDHCILKLNTNYWDEWNNDNFQGNILSENVDFLDYEIFDFELDEGSIAINSGSETIASEVPYDINGINRINNPDIGCFERLK